MSCTSPTFITGLTRQDKTRREEVRQEEVRKDKRLCNAVGRKGGKEERRRGRERGEHSMKVGIILNKSYNYSTRQVVAKDERRREKKREEKEKR